MLLLLHLGRAFGVRVVVYESRCMVRGGLCEIHDGSTLADAGELPVKHFPWTLPKLGVGAGS